MLSVLTGRLQSHSSSAPQVILFKTSNLLNITASYQQDGKPIKDLHEGDLVTVSLTSSWDQKAQDGCYTVRDRLPAGFMSVVNISFDRYAREPLYYPYDMTESEVSFVVCKQPKPFTIKYLARIVSLGRLYGRRRFAPIHGRPITRRSIRAHDS